MKDLAVVIPVYNEEEAIGSVLDKWVAALDKLGMDYTINPYNDGSKDGSWQVIQEKQKQYPGKIVGHDKANSGHGPTILRGYRDAAAAGYEWIFQIDSDDEMGPEGFAGLWENRDRYDFLAGTRDGRRQALPRKIISAVSRVSVRLFYGHGGIWDVNTPYRLMRAEAFQDVFRAIPSDTFAPNVIISGMAAKLKLRCFEEKVPQHDRTTGEVSIKKWKLLKAAVRSFIQAILFAVDQKPGMLSMLLVSGLVGLPLLVRTVSFWEMVTGKIQSSCDSSVFLTIAREMLHGALPYRDLFDHKGLYTYFIDIIGILTDLALVEWFFFALTAFILYRTLLLVVRPRLAFCLLLMWPFLLMKRKYLEWGNMTEEYMLPAIAFGIYYFVSLVKRKGYVDYVQTCLLGASAGLVFMLKLNYVSVFAATGVYLLWTLCSEKKFRVLSLTVLCGLAGLFASMLPALIYFLRHGLFSDFFETYILFNLAYSGAFPREDGNWFRFSRYAIILMYPWIAITVVFVKKTLRDEGDRAIALFIPAVLLLDFLTVWSGPVMYKHYLISLTPVALLSYALLVKYAARIVASIPIPVREDLRTTAFRLATGCLYGGALVFILSEAYQLKSDDCRRIFESGYFCPADENVAGLLKQHDGRLLVIGNYCYFYRLYDATPDGRYLFQFPIADVSPEIGEQFVEELKRKKTPLLLLPGNFTVPEYLRPVLREEYREMPCTHGTLYLRGKE